MDILDDIYEAAVVPDRWENALCSITREFGALEGALFAFEGQSPPTTVTFNQPDGLFEQYLDCWEESPSTRWGLSNCPPAFTTFRSNLPADVLDHDPAIRILRSRGIGDIAISVHPTDDDRKLGVGFARHQTSRNYSSRELSQLNALRPHIIRSMLVSARIGMERARSMVATLDDLGRAAAVLRLDGKVIASNSGIDAMPEMLIPTAFDGIRLCDRSQQARFEEALLQSGPGSDRPASTITIADKSNQSSALVHLLPIRGLAGDIFSGGQVLMVVIPVQGHHNTKVAMFEGLFDLTRAEARLLGELSEGGTLPEIAQRLGLSIHTVRTQFRAVADKTGLRRQTELARLLASL